MKVLIVGSGGREHALCWRIAQSPDVSVIYCAPGNAGTSRCATNVPIGATDIDALLAFAQREQVALTVVGPEAPLCAGIVDRFERAGQRIFGPSARAAALEGSKAFAKRFMERHSIPTASYGAFDDADAAASFVAAHPEATVVKADGLAAGKGVVVADDVAAAQAAVRQTFAGGAERVVIEQRLCGEEVSCLALTDGERIIPFASCQDHKAAFDGDRGPNTGGMGAYSPAPVLSSGLQQRVLDEILKPTIAGMAAEGTPYRGVLYAGLMIVDGAPHVIEFNCRFGDPETQPLMLRLGCDLLPYLDGVARGELPSAPLRYAFPHAISVVIASDGYPGEYRKHQEIDGLQTIEQGPGLAVFHAGTSEKDGRLVTSGGRVFAVTAGAEDLPAASRIAYGAVEKVRFAGAWYRRDIGHRAL